MTLSEWLGVAAGALGTMGATYGAVRARLNKALGVEGPHDGAPGASIRDIVMQTKGSVDQVAASLSRLEWGQDKLADRTTKLERMMGLGPEDDTPPQPIRPRAKMPSRH